jgi:hypothetical protein
VPLYSRPAMSRQYSPQRRMKSMRPRRNQPQFFSRLDWGDVKRSFEDEENNGKSVPDFVVQFLLDALPLGFLDR